MRKLFALSMAAGLMTVMSCSTTDEPTPTTTTSTTGNVVEISSSKEGTGTVTWSADSVYKLNGFVFVNEGQTLTIEPGTVIKGLPGQGSGASALIIAKGGKIMAEGTADKPIIFTAVADDMNGSVPDDAVSLWGGVIILGKATTSNIGEKSIEGIPSDTETRGVYGLPVSEGEGDDTDNSGVFKYVSIRHGGSVIGADNEINGLSLGAVGSGTTIDHVEILSNFDDGIEFFGGAVNLSNVAIIYPGDDGLDIDEGFHGHIQNALTLHTEQTLQSSDPRSGEWDGGNGTPEGYKPYANAVLANVTFVFEGSGITNAAIMRDNNSNRVFNCIFTGQDAPFAVEYRSDKAEFDGDKADSTAGSSWHRVMNGDALISNNLFYDVNGVTDQANVLDIFKADFAESETDAVMATVSAGLKTKVANNQVGNPGFGSGVNMYKPTGSAVTADIATLPSETGLTQLNYKGAVDPAGEPFYAGWTYFSEILSRN